MAGREFQSIDRHESQPDREIGSGGELAAARIWPYLVAALVLLAALLFAYPLSRVFLPISFNYSEGWNAFWQQAARDGRPLYAEAPYRTIVNYPPVSFHLVALITDAVGGTVNLTGRLIGIACLLWSACNVGIAARQVTASVGAGWLAALCLLLWVALMTLGRVGTNDPHFLALSFSTLGLCALLRSKGDDAWIAAAAASFATALFIKNAMLGFPIAAVVYLVSNRQWRGLLLFSAAGLLVGAIWSGLSLIIDGPLFLPHLVAKRLFDRATGISSLLRALTFLYAPILIAVAGSIASVRRRTSYPALCLLCAAAVDTGLVFGNGVAENIYYETLAALAVVVATSIDSGRRYLVNARHGGAIAVVCAVLAVAPAVVWAPGELYAALGRAGRLPQRAADYAAGVALLRTTPGPALCESLLMCVEAGKPFVFDAYYVKDQIGTGRLSEAQLVDDLNARRFGVIEIGEDDPGFQLSSEARLRFTSATMEAVTRNYQVALRTDHFAILLPF